MSKTPAKMQSLFNIGTVLLEKNRWAAGQTPSFKVSDWVPAFAKAGFHAIDLWANHALKADKEEIERLKSSQLPISVLNSYVAFDDGCEDAQDMITQMAISLNAQSIKYNVGHSVADKDTYLKNLRAWRERTPRNIRLICECHPGTIIEEPAAARAFFDTAQLENHAIIIHPFNISADRLHEWCFLFPEDIRLSHLQMRAQRDSESEIQTFDSNAKLVREAVQLLTKHGYSGDFTFEFTGGIRSEHESPETLFNNALKDIELFRELWSGS